MTGSTPAVESVDNADDARRYALAVFRSEVGEPLSIEDIPNSRNFLFRASERAGPQYVVKVYARTMELIGNCEQVAYERLQGNGFVRRCFGISRGGQGRPAWAIFEYVPGTTLLEAIERLQGDPELEQRVVGSILAFIEQCTAIGLPGYGDITVEFHGRYSAWKEFLDYCLERLEESVREVRDAEVHGVAQRGLAGLRRFRVSADDFLGTRPSCFVPVDLNMSNFLIGDDGRIVALDLENFLAADPLLALGEWTGHTFGTTRYETMMRLSVPLTGIEQACVRFYALLSNLDVLMYIANNRVADPKSARPWGNPNRFCDLIQIHAAWLEEHGAT